MRKIVQRVSNHSRAEQILFLKALLWLIIIKLYLVLLPFKTVRRIIASRSVKTTQSSGSEAGDINHVTWAVRVASRYIPRSATCLPQALATQVLLGDLGYATELRIGLAQDQDGQIKGHAWVERQGQIIIGGSEVSQFTLLNSLESR